MHEALVVCGGQAARELHAVLDRLAQGQQAAPQAFAQRFAVEELGDRVGQAILHADIVDGEDVRMRERRHRLGLALESRHSVGVAGQRRRQDLDGHVATEAGIARAVDLAHAAFAQLVEDAIRAEARTGCETHLVGELYGRFTRGRRDP